MTDKIEEIRARNDAPLEAPFIKALKQSRADLAFLLGEVERLTVAAELRKQVKDDAIAQMNVWAKAAEKAEQALAEANKRVRQLEAQVHDLELELKEGYE
jgi:hypothetical protein